MWTKRGSSVHGDTRPFYRIKSSVKYHQRPGLYGFAEPTSTALGTVKSTWLSALDERYLRLKQAADDPKPTSSSLYQTCPLDSKVSILYTGRSTRRGNQTISFLDEPNSKWHNGISIEDRCQFRSTDGCLRLTRVAYRRLGTLTGAPRSSAPSGGPSTSI